MFVRERKSVLTKAITLFMFIHVCALPEEMMNYVRHRVKTYIPELEAEIESDGGEQLRNKYGRKELAVLFETLEWYRYQSRRGPAAENWLCHGICNGILSANRTDNFVKQLLRKRVKVHHEKWTKDEWSNVIVAALGLTMCVMKLNDIALYPKSSSSKQEEHSSDSSSNQKRATSSSPESSSNAPICAGQLASPNGRSSSNSEKNHDYSWVWIPAAVVCTAGCVYSMFCGNDPIPEKPQRKIEPKGSPVVSNPTAKTSNWYPNAVQEILLSALAVVGIWKCYEYNMSTKDQPVEKDDAAVKSRACPSPGSKSKSATISYEIVLFAAVIGLVIMIKCLLQSGDDGENDEEFEDL